MLVAQVGESVSRAPERGSQPKLGEEKRLGGANVGVGSNQYILRSLDIGTPLEKRRRQARGNAWRKVLFGQSRAPWNRAGVAPQQQIDLVLLDGDLALQLR